MTLCFDHFFVAFLFIYIAAFSSAIYDPRATTTKPPERRESVLPWHSTETESYVQTTLRSPKWYQSQDNVTSKPSTKNWSSWRKAPNSEIEQRTQIDTQDYISKQIPEQISQKIPEQHHNFEFDQLKQEENLKPPSEYDFTYFDKNYNHFKHESKSNENRVQFPNEIEFEYKHPPRNDETKQTHIFQNENLYEGVAIDSTKPRKENILLSQKSQHKVARYNPQLGIQCPDNNSTGQFVYPLDCKFFVNCWKGRAFVQPCAPGTHFNPDTLECDFPHKVKCYEDEFAKFKESDSEFQVNRKSQKLQEPKCPPFLTGLLPHHGDCTKFVQCAHGVTYIMNCGPETVFNPVIGICDRPENVKGCEDAFKFDKSDKFSPPNLNFGHDKAKYIEVKISCPTDFTGFLPHPETCKKFLQCTNGITYIMDCGPGTVFNPVSTVCDWPYNVPSCKTDKFGDKVHKIEDSTWVRFDRIDDHKTHNSRAYVSRPEYSTTISTVLKPTWRPFMTSQSWIPTRTTPRPLYNRYEQTVNYHNRYQSRPVEENQYQDYTSHHPEWTSSSKNFEQPSDSNYKFQNHSTRQWARDYRTGQDSQQPNHPGGSWSGDINQDRRYGHEYYLPGQHYHYHHHHHYYGSTSNPPANPSWNSSSPIATIGNRKYDHGYHEVYTSNASDGHWRPDHDHHYNHHYVEHATSSETDQKQFQPYFPTKEHNEDDTQFYSKHNKTSFYAPVDDNLPSSRRIDHDHLLPNRQDHSGTNPRLHHPGFNNTSPLVGNVFLNSDNKFAANQNGSLQNGLSSPWAGQENIVWNQHNGSRFKPNTRHDQQNQEVQTEVRTRPWHQEESPFPVYYVQPVHPLTHSKRFDHLTPISGQTVRLRNGSGPNNGYVEVQGILPGWGIVCDSRNSWTLKEAHILCRQLGYIRGAEMAWQGRNNRSNMPTWIAANTVTCHGNETRFQSCKFTHNQECRVDRDAIGVRCVSNRVAHCRKDEIPHNGHCYYLADPSSGLNHAEALDHCKQRNARLIDITNQAENNFVSEWLLQSHPKVSSIMTSGFGFATMNRSLWLWADSTHAKFKFTKWWPGWMNDTLQPPWVGSRPLCIVMKRKFPCHERPESICNTDYFFWDTEDCATTSKGHSFICKRPYDDIGCVYGKGNQYTGKANVTVLGNKCLSWADERIAHQLRINVVNEQIREKLKTHNYCRNPNPIKESRPWCFIENGEREYCDIPACGNIDSKRSMLTGQCKPKHFECTPGECIPSPWVCDGEEDCTNGADERKCIMDLNLFEKSAKHKLDGYDVEKWLNTPLKTCALRCKEADFTCRSFNHKSDGNVCLLSNSNIGLTGALKPDKEFDYYEMRERSVNCDGMYICNNHKCINQTKVCDGKNDCNDRSDESICTAENFDYSIRLAGANNSYEGRVEVKILGYWGQVCDDGFGMINADVICKELGFELGALEVRPGGFYGNLDPPTRFMVDQLKCRGNETTLRECDFNGWGVHNCQPEEAVGIVCKIAVNTCQEGYWKCDNSPTCIPTPFICDEVTDCPDHSDESPEHCDAPFELRLANGSGSLQGRVEVRHHGVWGTVCDDDFTNATAMVICRSLGYGGIAIAKKNGFFGPGQGPIWLDEVFCHGNESQLYRCEHNHWGQHNCDHNEDAGVICSPGDINNAESYWVNGQEHPEQNIDELLPSNCGQRAKDFNDDGGLIFQKVVHGSIAPRGTYPWQASIRVRGHSRSSHWCGAVIISPLHVLTAAHCLEGYNKGTYFVRAGDYNTDINEGTEVEANIEDYYVHEEFRKGHRMNNDIALVLLKGLGIPLGNDIMPICLPPENIEYSPGLNCTISGFGSVETGKTTQSKDLRYGWVPLLDQSICRASYVYGEGAISDGMMCAGYLDEGIDTCDGDSGGPLACYHNGAFSLYGITSWGQHCGKANRPGVYVRVAYYRRWIDKKIRESLAGR
ncbi:uncharacterized protein LOC105422952 isoform X2 [Pogonomyrmex barbatus]|uniref:limulus clotting factor C n=1 Tax=Pogonomyrmex barbatus TaxID=144034 RepID=A0A6I9WGK8_9HYME|nr:uncharacterized protein LOC105422952 isoform X2 [Pogonomyrmex barbatus]